MPREVRSGALRLAKLVTRAALFRADNVNSALHMKARHRARYVLAGDVALIRTRNLAGLQAWDGFALDDGAAFPLLLVAGDAMLEAVGIPDLLFQPELRPDSKSCATRSASWRPGVS